MRSLRRLAPALVLVTLLVPATGRAWPTLLPDTPDNGRPFTVAADSEGNVLVAGRVLAVTDPTARMDPEERRYARASAASGGGGDGRDVPVLPTPRRLSAALIVEIELTD